MGLVVVVVHRDDDDDAEVAGDDDVVGVVRGDTGVEADRDGSKGHRRVEVGDRDGNRDLRHPRDDEDEDNHREVGDIARMVEEAVLLRHLRPPAHLGSDPHRTDHERAAVDWHCNCDSDERRADCGSDSVPDGAVSETTNGCCDGVDRQCSFVGMVVDHHRSHRRRNHHRPHRHLDAGGDDEAGEGQDRRRCWPTRNCCSRRSIHSPDRVVMTFDRHDHEKTLGHRGRYRRRLGRDGRHHDRGTVHLHDRRTCC